MNKELQFVKNQIDNRNFSGANKMLYNIVKFQKNFVYLQSKMFFLILLNQFILIKFKLKNFIFKYFSRNNEV